MHTYAEERTWRQAAFAFLLMIGMVALAAAVVGLGWWTWDNVVNNPMPYRDPEPRAMIDGEAPDPGGGHGAPVADQTWFRH
jgi:hypothetical protein